MKKSIYVILEGSPVPNHVKEQSDLADQYMRILLESEEAFRHVVTAEKVRGVIREMAGSKTRSGTLIGASKTGVRDRNPTGAVLQVEVVRIEKVRIPMQLDKELKRRLKIKG